MSCGHKICGQIKSELGNKTPGGVGCVIVRKEYGKNDLAYPYFLLGREVAGSYSGKYNLCAGKLDPKDKGCILKNLLRELYEEVKINLYNDPKTEDINWKKFDRIFKNFDKIRYFIFRGTPVFVGYFENNDFSVQVIRNTIKDHIQKYRNGLLSYPFAEMDDARMLKINFSDPRGFNNLVKTYDKQNNDMVISTFASSTIIKAMDILQNQGYFIYVNR